MVASRQVVACAAPDVFTLTARGIYYVPCGSGVETVHLVSLLTGSDLVVRTLEKLDMGDQTDLAMSPDGSKILVCEKGRRRPRRPVDDRELQVSALDASASVADVKWMHGRANPRYA
jgi:hypothetical protein